MRSTRSWPFFERRSVDGAWNRFLIAHLQTALIGAGWKYRHLGNTKRKNSDTRAASQNNSCFIMVPLVRRLRSGKKCRQESAECLHYRRKFRSQTSDNMDRWKAEQGRGREKRKIKERRVRRKKMQMREKVGKSRNTVFFQWFGAPEGRKVGSLKRRVWSQLARWETKNCTPLWREAHFQVKMLKTLGVRTTFGSSDLGKVHAVVARSTFRSEHVQNTPWSDHFWKLRCWKSGRLCGAKHISKSKCTKHTMVGHLFGSSDVEKVHTVVARSTFRNQKVQSTPRSDHFWKFWCRKSARRCGAKHISKSKC